MARAAGDANAMEMKNHVSWRQNVGKVKKTGMASRHPFATPGVVFTAPPSNAY